MMVVAVLVILEKDGIDGEKFQWVVAEAGVYVVRTPSTLMNAPDSEWMNSSPADFSRAPSVNHGESMALLSHHQTPAPSILCAAADTSVYWPSSSGQ